MVISFLLRTCSYNEPGLSRQASETTGHFKPFRVFLTIPSHAQHDMRGALLLDSGVLGSTTVQKPQLIFKPIEK
jgi:hypothetical protein